MNTIGTQTLLFAVAAAGLFTSAACSPPQIAQRPLIRGGIAPLERPEVFLHLNDKPAEPGDSGNLVFRCRLTGAGFSDAREDAGADEQSLYSMRFVSPDEQNRFNLSFAVPRSFTPRLKTGRTYSVVYFYRHRELFLPPSLGVVVRDETGGLLYLLSGDDGVPSENLPAGLKLTPVRRPVSVTSTFSQSGCTIDKEHYFLQAEARGKKHLIAPGEEKILRTLAGYYRLVLFDNSVSSGDIECLAENPPHFSFLVEAVEAP